MAYVSERTCFPIKTFFFFHLSFPTWSLPNQDSTMFFQSVIVTFYQTIFCRVINLINEASLGRPGRTRGVIGHQSFLYGPRCIWVVLSRPQVSTSREKPSRLVTSNSTSFNLNKPYILPWNIFLRTQVCLLSYTIFLRCLPVSQQNT